MSKVLDTKLGVLWFEKRPFSIFKWNYMHPCNADFQRVKIDLKYAKKGVV
jgi:hypothetical protein